MLRQDPSLVAVAALPDPSAVSPYQGLAAYDVDDSDVYFGRDSDVATCLRKLADTSVLVVVGPSGCGKSSLVRAGIAAAVRRDGSPVAVITPGAHPMASLAALPAKDRKGLLVVDQAEEVFSVCQNESERGLFLSALAGHASDSRLVISMRADRLADVSSHPGFARLVEQGLYLLGAMSEDDLRAAIEGPAHQAALVVEPGLVDLLVHEVHGQPGALPLMSHALRETWLRREGRTLTVAGYRESGGIRDAVSRSAEEVYDQVDQDQRHLLRDLLLRLVTPGTEGDPVRSRLPRRLVVTDSQHDRMIDLLVSSRLVTSDQDVIELAHEALARAWPRLRGWLEDDVEGQRILHHLAMAADSWDSLGRPESELYRGVRLAKALEWRQRSTPLLTAVEQEFLDRSQRLSEAALRAAEDTARRKAHTNRRLRSLLAVAVVLLLAATAAGVYAARQTDRAETATDAAEQAAISADAGRVGAKAQLSDDISLSLLLAAEGVRMADSPETRVNLLSAVNERPRLVRSTPGAGGYTEALDASPDGRFIASGDDRGQLHVYDAATGRRLHTIPRLEAPTDALVFSYGLFTPDGRYLAVVSFGEDARIFDARIRLIDTRTWLPVEPSLQAPDMGFGRMVHVAASGDGRYLAASVQRSPEPDGEWLEDPAFGLVWDLRALDRPPHRVDLGTGGQGIALSPDGRTIYSQWPLTARDIATGKTVWRRADIMGWIAMDVDPSGTMLALEKHDEAIADSIIPLVDARTGKTRRLLRGHANQPRGLAFSNDGTMLASALHDGEIIVWDVAAGRPKDRWRTFEQSWGVGFSPDDTLVHSSGDDGMLRTWDLAGRQTFLRRTAGVEGTASFTHADVSPDGRRVAYWWLEDEDGWIRFVDTVTGASTPPQPLPVSGGPWTPGLWHPDGVRYASHAGCHSECGDGGAVTLLDATTGKILMERRVVDDEIYSMAYVDGATLLVGDSIGKVTALDAQTLLPRGDPFDVPSDCCITPAPDGPTALLYDDSSDGASERWRVIDVSSGEVRKEGDLDLRAYASTASPDGEWVAVTGQTGEVVAIELSTGSQRRGSTGLGAEVFWLRYSDDGTRLVSGAADGAVSLWDGKSLQLLGTVYPPQEGEPVPASGDFIGDSHNIAIAAYDGQIYHWDTGKDRAVRFACQMAGRDMAREEWAQTFDDRPYEKTCPQLSP